MIQVAGIYEDGHITLLTPIYKKRAHVIVTVLEEGNEPQNTADSAPLSKRIPGLHKGAYMMADDFDAPLPDTFWLGEE